MNRWEVNLGPFLHWKFQFSSNLVVEGSGNYYKDLTRLAPYYCAKFEIRVFYAFRAVWPQMVSRCRTFASRCVHCIGNEWRFSFLKNRNFRIWHSIRIDDNEASKKGNNTFFARHQMTSLWRHQVFVGGVQKAPHLFSQDNSKTERARFAIFWHTCRKMMKTSNKKIIFEIGQNLAELQRLKHKLRISEMWKNG